MPHNFSIWIWRRERVSMFFKLERKSAPSRSGDLRMNFLFTSSWHFWLARPEHHTARVNRHSSVSRHGMNLVESRLLSIQVREADGGM